MKHKIAFLLTIFWSSFLLASPVAVDVSNAIRFDVEKYKLDNGMTVILHEDHSAPNINSQLYYRVGARHEKPGRTGLAHFFEHLMFKGTKNYGDGEISRLIKSNGGDLNAYTTFDHTAYIFKAPTHALDLVLKFESDRMRNLLFNPKTIQKEREVVKEERRVRYDNSIKGQVTEATYKSVFKVHPYKNLIIGSMADLNAASIDDFKKFYKTYYAPNNAILVLTGDFKKEQAKKLIARYFGEIRPETLPEENVPQEPEQRSTRRVTLEKDIQSAKVVVVYKGVSNSNDDAYALDMMSSILGDGKSSRLHKRLIYHGQLATSTYAWSYSLEDPGVYQIFADIKPGKSRKRAISIIEQEVKKLQTKLVTKKELEKAKNQMMKSYVDGLKTASGKARVLGAYEVAYGDYSRVFSDLEKYKAVTREQIREVARKYLKKSRANIIQLVPETAKKANNSQTSLKSQQGA